MSRLSLSLKDQVTLASLKSKESLLLKGQNVPSPDASDNREPAALMLLLLGLAAFVEGADTQLMPASTLALQAPPLKFTLAQLASLNVAQAVCVNIAAPFWGILADRRVTSRRNLLLLGAMGQAVACMCLSQVHSLLPMILLRCWAGMCLASLRPIANGIVAEITSESKHGKIFGRLQSFLLLGMFSSTMVVIPVARMTIFGFPGWRVAFFGVGLLSIAVCCTLFFLFEEPVSTEERPRMRTEEYVAQNERSIIMVVFSEISKLTAFFRLPTFCLMIVQGIFGTIPYTVMGLMASYFQLCGISDTEAAILAGEMALMGVPGNILGGLVADKLAATFGAHGRPLSAQLTILLGLTPLFQIYYGVSPGPNNFWVYLALIAFFGLFGCWAQSGTNFPILSDIVPAESRSSVMAWESAFENSVANAVGPFAAAFLATNLFGYNLKDAPQGESIPMDLDAAKALGSALATVSCIPAMICFCAYSVMHWSYPRDSRSIGLCAKASQENSPSYGTTA
jgi:MFS family permease